MISRGDSFHLWCVALAVSWLPGWALAQDAIITPEPESASAGPPLLAESIAQKRAELATELAAARRNLESASVIEGDTPPEPLTKRVELLETIDLLYGQQHAQVQRLEELQTSQVQLEADLDALRATGPPEERPDSFLLLESVRSELNAHVDRGADLQAAREAAADALASAREQYEARERARRQAKEALESAAEDTDVAELTVIHRLAELDSQLTRETVALGELEQRSQEVVDSLYRLRLTFLTEKVAWIEDRARFTQVDLREQLAKVDREEFNYRRQLEVAKLDLESAARRLANARQRRDAAPETEQVLVEEVEAARLGREAQQLNVLLFQARLQRLILLKQLWTRRFRTFNSQANHEELMAWQAEARDTRAQLDSQSRLQSGEAAEARKSLVTLQEKLVSANEAGPQVGRWLREQIRHVETLIGSHESSVAGIETTRRLADKLLAEIGGETAGISLADRISSLSRPFLAVWRYELTSVDDRPITVSKIVIGILLLVVGVSVTRYFSRFVGRRLLPRVGLDEGAAAAIQSILFYVLVLTLGLVSLRVVNVPLTAFTIVGGALAIGVGFGSQNLINNFISGLILLVERPIRVGDLIEIDKLLGTIQHIGPRSTHVRSAENIDIIVPNSTFLERNVINWTLSDDRYRAHVVIGLAYGSPTREAAKLIRRVVDEHGKILKTPKPIVLFTEFGDNALNFEVHFWIRMRRMMDRRMIESDIRYRIDALFREAGIVIAFPQRDVHLDTATPLEVRLLPDQPGVDPVSSEGSARSRPT
ncbi:MAG: mechanosensitive ion channel [Planctomycetes bacterium]|nr:mechanosensitive ion channel [Planctomycetota bacterium]